MPAVYAMQPESIHFREALGAYDSCHGQAGELMIRKAAIHILPESNMAFCTWTLGGYLFEKLELPWIYCISIELPGLLWTHVDIFSMTYLTWGFSVLNPDYPASAGF